MTTFAGQPGGVHRGGRHTKPENDSAAGGAEHRLAVPGPSAEVEAQKRAQLRKNRAIATAFLIVAAAVYFACRWVETSHASAGEAIPGWVAYVRAASEAGMVGALADWFAVVALFRHPLGIPIPHTAIVRRKKDQVGESLAQFVGDNFLNPTLIVDKVRKAQVPERVGQWLVEPGNADKVSAEVGRFVGNALEAVNPDDAAAVLKTAVIDEVAGPEWGPPTGRVLEQLIAEGRTEPIVQQMADWLHRKSLTSQPLIDRMVGERAPSWAPSFVNDLIGDKVYREVVDWTWNVAHDPNHDARLALHRFLRKLADDLQNDQVTIDKVEDLKNDILTSAAVTAAPAKIWESTSTKLIEAARDPESLLRRKIAETAANYGQRVNADPELRRNIGDYLEKAVVFISENYSGEITSIISETVERWDADEAADKIELMVGSDLQYIRINGTVVGALAGFAIYTLSTLIFG
nr:DUF445 family protein [Corynebacterium lactis]